MKTEQTALQTIAEAARCPEYDPPMVKATPLGSDGAVAPSDFSSDETNRRGSTSRTAKEICEV